MSNFTESEIEIFFLTELKQLGFSYIPGPSIAPDVESAVREQPLRGFLVAEPAAPYANLPVRCTQTGRKNAKVIVK
jgi:hypothetical protein